jgi:hypothetical protein
VTYATGRVRRDGSVRLADLGLVTAGNQRKPAYAAFKAWAIATRGEHAGGVERYGLQLPGASSADTSRSALLSRPYRALDARSKIWSNGLLI